MTWAAVGSPVVAQGTPANATPTPTTLGNIVVVAITGYWGLFGPGVGYGGGGVTTWNQVSPDPLGFPVTSPGTTPNAELTTTAAIAGTFIFWGVITATGPQPFYTTAALSSSFIYQEFSPPPGVVGQDPNYGQANARSSDPPVTSGAWPAVVPSGSNELFIGSMELFQNADGTKPVLNGTTAGFTYVSYADSAMVYKCNVASPTSYAPAWTVSGGTVLAPMFDGFLYIVPSVQTRIVMMP